jgi:hypothetical protein
MFLVGAVSLPVEKEVENKFQFILQKKEATHCTKCFTVGVAIRKSGGNYRRWWLLDKTGTGIIFGGWMVVLLLDLLLLVILL